MHAKSSSDAVRYVHAKLILLIMAAHVTDTSA